MRPRTIVMRASLAALLATAPVLVLAGPAAAAFANPDVYVVAEDTQLVGNVLDNDLDEGFGLTAVQTSAPTNGSLSMNSDGSFVYQPDAHFAGVDMFTYFADDGVGPISATSVSITVTPVYDPAVVVPDAYSTPGGTQLSVGAPGLLANDSSPDGLLLVVDDVTADPLEDLVVASDGSFDFTPSVGFRGDFTFTYSVSDGVTVSSPVAVTIAVDNTAPVAEPDSYDVAEDTTLTATTVLANDSDANGDTLTAVLVSGPSSGDLTFAADGTFTYAPVANFNGIDSFTYAASDGTSTSAPATVTLTVDAVADRPVFAVPILAVTAVEDTTYTGQTTATSADGLPLTYTAETTGTPTGSVVMNAVTGDFTFTPEPDFVGLAQLDVLACDTFGQCATQLVNITVTNTNDAPVATDQTVSVSRGTPVPQMFDVRDIDSQVLTFTVTTAAQRGTVVIDADMWTFVYAPTAGTSGLDSFVVEICDADGLCDSATVTLDVAAAPPVTVTPVAAPVDAAAPVGPAAAGTPGSDALPVTGADVTSLALGALGMIGLGSVLVARGSRRVVRE